MIDVDLYKVDNKIPRGKHAFMFGDLKIFDVHEVTKKGVNDIEWGEGCVMLREATKIQNYCWMHGLAPRIYKVTTTRFNDKVFMAQKTELINESNLHGGNTTEKEIDEMYSKVAKLGDIYGFEFIREDLSVYDLMGGKLIDFNVLRFTEDHDKKVASEYKRHANYGKTYYHPISSLGLNSAPRKNSQRVKEMGLDAVDFTDKTVLDLGCAGGGMSMYADSRGAFKVTGLDHAGYGSPNPVMGASIACNELEHWNIDILDKDLKKPFTYDDIVSFGSDIVFFFSMSYHVGVPDWLRYVTKELCIVEDNSKNRDAKEKLEKMFKRVEFVGYTTDRGEENKLPVYYCYKNLIK